MLWKAGLGVAGLVMLGGKSPAAKPPPWWVCEVQPVPERGFEVPGEGKVGTGRNWSDPAVCTILHIFIFLWGRLFW